MFVTSASLGIAVAVGIGILGLVIATVFGEWLVKRTRHQH